MDSIRIKKKNLWKYFAVVVIAVAIIAGFVYFNKPKADGVEIPVSAQDPQIGNTDAKVTVVEFSDYSCPFCAAASGYNEEMVSYMKERSPNWEPIVSNLMKDYVDTGKVRFVAKYSQGHSGGHPAQLVAWCLNDQSSELHWEFYKLAYENLNDVENLTKMKTLAEGLNADMAELNECLDSGKHDSRFNEEQSQGANAGVRGTPAFFVNGKMIVGAVPYSQFKAIVDEAL